MNPFNPNPDIEIIDIDGHQLVIIDNVFSDPEAMREYAHKTWLLPKLRGTSMTGYHCFLDIDDFEKHFPNYRRELVSRVHSLVGESVRAFYGLGDDYSQMNIYKGPLFSYGHKRSLTLTPHVDSGHISSFTYLNLPERCWGGTAIYRFKPYNTVTIIQDPSRPIQMPGTPLTEDLTYSTDEWELVHKIEMRYNRMCIFNASLIHKLFFEPGEMKFSEGFDTCRLTLNAFFEYVRGDN